MVQHLLASHGPGQPELAPTLNNLALLCAASGRHGEAESLYLRAIALLQAAVSPTHPTLAACRENHAALNSQHHKVSETRT